jgi:GT2 family glycosyltransferase
MISISIVSHGHGQLIPALLLRLLEFSEVSQVIVTLNIPEFISLPLDSRIQLVTNNRILGFGANHNKAFKLGTGAYFCVLNPDISIITNPFPNLLKSFSAKEISLVAPMVKNLDGSIEDSVRQFPTPIRIALRRFSVLNDCYKFEEGDENFTAEWVGGMCMLFRSSAYTQIDGFDERYFMYVEDVDICTRLWKAGLKVIVCPNAIVIHEARRSSRRKWQHLRWHISSLLKYFSLYAGRLPRV